MPASDLLTETQACDLLARLFRARGFKVVRNIPFQEYGVSFHIDGWDAKQRVGFEFLTSEDEDHDDLTLGEYQTLMAAQQRGELSLFILDEVEPLSAADLAGMADDFLDELAQATAARKAGRARRAGKQPAGRKPTRKTRPAAKPSATGSRAHGAAKPSKRVGKKPAKKIAKKPAKKPAVKRSPMPKTKPAAKRRRAGS